MDLFLHHSVPPVTRYPAFCRATCPSLVRAWPTKLFLKGCPDTMTTTPFRSLTMSRYLLVSTFHRKWKSTNSCWLSVKDLTMNFIWKLKNLNYREKFFYDCLWNAKLHQQFIREILSPTLIVIENLIFFRMAFKASGIPNPENLFSRSDFPERPFCRTQKKAGESCGCSKRPLISVSPSPSRPVELPGPRTSSSGTIRSRTRPSSGPRRTDEAIRIRTTWTTSSLNFRSSVSPTNTPFKPNCCIDDRHIFQRHYYFLQNRIAINFSCVKVGN